MTQLGLISVSFRHLEPKKIIDLAVRAGLQGIEWGSDVHVPAGDLQTAETVGRMTRQAGLEVFSYGSYFYAGEDDIRLFPAIVDSAVVLKTNIIRIWAGKKASAKADEAYFARVVADTQAICDMAAAYGITICFEYHPNTLTDDCNCACRLLREIQRENLKLYWQPNPKHTFEQNVNELRTVLPYVVHVHVFQWDWDCNRFPLSDGMACWTAYRDLLYTGNEIPRMFLEFFMDDSGEQMLADSLTLQQLFGDQ